MWVCLPVGIPARHGLLNVEDSVDVTSHSLGTLEVGEPSARGGKRRRQVVEKIGIVS